MEEIEWNESSRRKRNSIIFPIVKKSLFLYFFKVDDGGSQIAVIFRSHWMHLKEWYDSLFWNVNIYNTPGQRFSNCGSWASSIRITWELDRFSAWPQPHRTGDSVSGRSHPCFNLCSRWLWRTPTFENPCIRNDRLCSYLHLEWISFYVH